MCHFGLFQGYCWRMIRITDHVTQLHGNVPIHSASVVSPAMKHSVIKTDNWAKRESKHNQNDVWERFQQTLSKSANKCPWGICLCHSGFFNSNCICLADYGLNDKMGYENVFPESNACLSMFTYGGFVLKYLWDEECCQKTIGGGENMILHVIWEKVLSWRRCSGWQCV